MTSVRTVLIAVILVGAENVVGRGEIERLGAGVAVVAAGRSRCHEKRSWKSEEGLSYLGEVKLGFGG